MKKENVPVYILLVIFTIIALLPIIWIMLSSFKTGSELFRYPPTIWPDDFTFDNYKGVLQENNFGRIFLNSFFVAITSTILTLIINCMAGYAFAKYKFKGRDLIFVLFLATLIVPLEVIMIPMFQVLKFFGLVNSLWGIIIPPAATPTGVFLVRQYMLSVPDAIIEAARIDGASEKRIFLTLILPIAKPVLAVLAIFSFMWRWNDFLWPLLVISTPDLYTLQLALANFSGQYSVDWNSIMAMSVISMIPVIIVFLLFQKQFVRGMVVSGMKE